MAVDRARPEPDRARRARRARGLGSGRRPPGSRRDHLFRCIALAGGLMVLVILGLIAYSTTKEAWPWFRAGGPRRGLLRQLEPGAEPFGALALIYGTFLVGFLALLFAVPVSIGIALFVTEIAPRPLAEPIIYIVDLLAAIPSVVYGLWAISVLIEPLADIFASISDATRRASRSSATSPPTRARPAAAYMTAGIIVAIMITPIITSITREVFATTPAPLKEAAYGLGSTQWEMIRGAVFPHSRGASSSAVMIGLGRAIGETIAVVAGHRQRRNASARTSSVPGDTMASTIVAEFGEATGIHRAALIGLGVVLFVLTVARRHARPAASSRRYDRRSGGGAVTVVDPPIAPRSILAPRPGSTPRKIRNRIATVLIGLTFLVALVPLVAVVVYVIQRGVDGARLGLPHRRHPDLRPRSSGRAWGRRWSARCIITGAAALMAIPLGILGGIYLNEYGGREPAARGSSASSPRS